MSSSSSLCESRRIGLRKLAQELYLDNRSTGYRLKVVAYNACGMDAEIFRWFRAPPDLSGDRWDFFSGVCSAYEMTAIPKDEPDESGCPQQFRLDYFDIILPSQHLADEVWNLIQGEVAILVETLNLADTLVEEETVEIGG